MACASFSSKLNKFLHSEVNQLIQHIIVQDQDGQKTTGFFFFLQNMWIKNIVKNLSLIFVVLMGKIL